MYILYFKEEHNRVVRKSMESESLLLFSIENITHCDYALPLPNLVFLSILRKLFNQQQKKKENRKSIFMSQTKVILRINFICIDYSFLSIRDKI